MRVPTRAGRQCRAARRRPTVAQQCRPSGRVYPLRHNAESAGVNTSSARGAAGAVGALRRAVDRGAVGASVAQAASPKVSDARKNAGNRTRMGSSGDGERLDTVSCER